MHRRDGFTMVEVIVVVAVIAILGGILTPMVIKEISKSKLTRAEADMEAVSIAFTQYFADTGYWPEKYTGTTDRRATFRNYDCFYDNTRALTGWDGPYMEKGAEQGGTRVVANRVGSVWEGVVDPWGRPFRIVYGKVGGTNAGGGIAILTSGPDGSFATSDADALRGSSTGDDIVRIVTARAGL